MPYEEEDIEQPQVSLEDVARQLSAAIGLWENRGDDNMSTYMKQNKDTKATGRYQFTPKTLADDSERYFGKPVDINTFKNDPEMQDELMYRRTLDRLKRNYKASGSFENAIRTTAIQHIGTNGKRGLDAPAYSVDAGKEVGESPNQYADAVINILNTGSYQPASNNTPKDIWAFADNKPDTATKKKPMPTMPVDTTLGYVAKDIWAFADNKPTDATTKTQQPASAEMPLITPKSLVRGITERAAKGDRSLPSGARMDVLTDNDVTAKREERSRIALEKEKADIAKTNAILNSRKAKELLPIPKAVKSLMDSISKAYTQSLTESPEFREKVKQEESDRALGEQYQAGIASGKIDKELSFEKYREGQKKLQTQALMVGSGPVGTMLAMASGMPGSNIPPQFGRQMAIAVNSLSGNILSSVDPQSYSKFMDMTSMGGPVQTGLDLTTGLVSQIGGMKLLAKVAGPILSKLTPQEQMGAIMAAQQAPGNIISVAKGDKDLVQAIGETAVAGASGYGAIGGARMAPEIARAIAPGSKSAPYIVNALAQGGINTASEVGYAGVTGEDVTPEGIASAVALGIGLSTGDLRGNPAMKGVMRDVVRAADERVAKIDATIDDVRRSAFKTQDPEARAEKFRSVQDLIDIRKDVIAETPTLVNDKARIRANERIAASSTDGAKDVSEVAIAPAVEGMPDKIISAAVKVGDSVFEGATHGEAVDKAVASGALVRDSEGRLTIESGDDLGAFDSIDLFKTESGRLVDRFEASKEFGVTAAEDIVAEPAEANFGKPTKATKTKPSTKETPVEPTAPPEELPKFNLGDRVFSYDTAETGTGTKIISGLPTRDGVIVEKDGVQMIKGEKGKLTPVDMNTQLSGKGHPLTAHMVSANAPTSFLVRAFADEVAKTALGGKVDNKLMGYVARGMERMGMFKASVGEDGVPVVQIGLAKKAFNDPNLIRSIFAHEVGHFVDYIGDAKRNIPNTLNRGNLIGHAKTLYKFNEGEMLNLTNKELRAEYEAVSKAWNPHPLDADPKYTKYRNSPKELTADFFSAMINNPELVKQQAPKAYDRFMSDLQYKPKVEEAFNTFRDLFTGTDKEAHGRMVREFSKNESEQASNMLSENLAAAEEKKNRRASVGKKLAQMFNENAPLYDIDRMVQKESNAILKKNDLRWKDYTRYWDFKKGAQTETATKKFNEQYSDGQLKALEEVFQAKGESKFSTEARIVAFERQVVTDAQAYIVERFNRDIVQPLEKVGVKPEDAAEYLRYTSIIGGQRDGQANSGLMEVADATEGLATMRKDLGEQKFGALEAKMSDLRENVFAKMKEAREAGLISAETWNTFERNKDAYSRFVGAKYATDQIRWTTDRAKGTLDAVGDNLLATMQQLLATDSKIRDNNAAKVLIDNLPADEITELPANSQATANVLQVYRDGKLHRYQVDPYFVDMFKYQEGVPDNNIRQLGRIIRGTQREIFIDKSLSFQLRNWMRDFQASIITTTPKILKFYGSSLKEGWNVARGKEEELGTRALRAGLLHPQARTMLHSVEPSPNKTLLKVLGQDKSEKKKIFQKTRERGSEANAKTRVPMNAVEAMPKLAALQHYEAQGIPTREAALLASFAGTPDTRVRGKLTKKLNVPFLFFNTNLQGSLRAARLMRDPQTRSGYIARMVTQGVAPKMAQWALQYGWMIPAAREIYGDDSDEVKWFEEKQMLYERAAADMNRRYLTFPIDGAVDKYGNAAVKMLTIPQDESAILWSSEVDNLIEATQGKNLFKVGGDLLKDAKSMTVPNEDPNIKMMKGIAGYIMQGNVYDDFRQQEVLNAKEEAIASAPMPDDIKDWDNVGVLNKYPLAKLGEWALQTTFGGWFSLAKSARAISQGEDVSSNVIVPGWYSTTAGGTLEKINSAAKSEAAEQAVKSLDTDEAVRQARKMGSTAPIDALRLEGDGTMSDQTYKNLLKEVEMSQGDYYLSKSTISALKKKMEAYQEVGDDANVIKIQDIIRAKEKKKKNK